MAVSSNCQQLIHTYIHENCCSCMHIWFFIAKLISVRLLLVECSYKKKIEDILHLSSVKLVLIIYKLSLILTSYLCWLEDKGKIELVIDASHLFCKSMVQKLYSNSSWNSFAHSELNHRRQLRRSWEGEEEEKKEQSKRGIFFS